MSLPACAERLVFANGPGHWGSIAGLVIQKTQKIVLYISLLNSQYYKVCIRIKWRNPGKGVASSSTPRCSRYWNERLRVGLDYGRPTTATTIHTHTHTHTHLYIYILHFNYFYQWSLYALQSYNHILYSHLVLLRPGSVYCFTSLFHPLSWLLNSLCLD